MVKRLLLSLTIGSISIALVYAWYAQQFAFTSKTDIHLQLTRRYISRPGLEILEARIYGKGAFRGKLLVLYADLDHNQLSIALNPGEKPLLSFLNATTSVVNAGYFTRRRRPTGLLISEGQILHPFIRRGGSAGSGVLVITKGNIQLVERDQVTSEHLQKADFAIQAGPRVIEKDGCPGIHSDDHQRANRTVIGYDAQQRLAIAVIYATDAGIGSGPTLYELQDILGPHGLGSMDPRLSFTAALNLDGGPSTGIHTPASATPTHFPPREPVVSILKIQHSPLATPEGETAH